MDALILEEAGDIKVCPEGFTRINSIIRPSVCIAILTLVEHKVSNKVQHALLKLRSALRRTPHLS